MSWVPGQLPTEHLLLDALEIIKLGFPYNRHLPNTNINPKSNLEGTERCALVFGKLRQQWLQRKNRHHRASLAKPRQMVGKHFFLCVWKRSKSRLTLRSRLGKVHLRPRLHLGPRGSRCIIAYSNAYRQHNDAFLYSLSQRDRN